MTLKNEILSLLLSADGYVSGEDIAARFGKSRAAVWKAIKSLKADGYGITAQTHSGYKLTDSKNLVSAQGIRTYLKNDIPVEYFSEVDSTNNVCKRMLADGRSGAFLVAANQQTSGRGRQGKSFYSPADTGIYFSLVLRPNTSLQNAVTATTAAAVAVCRAIEKLTDKKPQIKWVNDVYLDGKKICGILTEAVTNFEEGTVDSVIIGIGINVSTADFPQALSQAGSLDADVNRNQLVAGVVDELIGIADAKYDEFIDYYRSHSYVLGKKINFIKNGKVTPATAIAIDESGGLVVELDDNSTTTLRSGEISVRLK